jgi:O-antigen/teichoic acid export membrane protein
MILLLGPLLKPYVLVWVTKVKRILAQTLSIQSLGVLLMFITTLLVSRLGGANAQGNFAFVKSMNDFQVAVFSFGMPSAIVYLLNLHDNAHFKMLRFIWLYSFILLIILPIFSYGVLYWIYPELNIYSRINPALLIGMSSALLTGYGLQRAVLLVRNDGPIFSILSIVPACVVVISIIIFLNRTIIAAEIAYALAGLISIIFMHIALRRALRGLPPDDPELPIDWRVLRTQSSHVFAQGILFGLQVFLTNAALESANPNLVAVGLFNVASMVITLPNLLVSLVAPVLFNRWSKSLTWAGYATIKRFALILATTAQGLAFLTIPLVIPVLSFVFGPEFEAASEATTIMLGSVLAVFAGRILTPALQGLGQNWIVTWSCVARLALGAIIAIFVSSLGYPPIIYFAIGWLGGEYAALLIIIILPYLTTKNLI